MLNSLIEISARYAGAFIGLALFSMLSIFLVMTLGVRILTRLPADYFIQRERRDSKEYLKYFHPVVRPLMPALKNIAGIVLIVAGLLMLFLPGQGMLTVLAGLMLTDLPGKYGCERWLLKRPQVRQSINWLRRRSGQTELEFD
jgi:archaellum biogenesis protein FlaJ (TadC family)